MTLNEINTLELLVNISIILLVIFVLQLHSLQLEIYHNERAWVGRDEYKIGITHLFFRFRLGQVRFLFIVYCWCCWQRVHGNRRNGCTGVATLGGNTFTDRKTHYSIMLYTDLFLNVVLKF